MRKSWLVLIWMVVLSSFGCGDPLSGTNDFLTFTIGSETGVIGDDTIDVVVTDGTDLTALVPTFTTNGTKVVAGGVDQISGQTAVNFTSPVRYRVIAANLSAHEYVVTVATVPPTLVVGGTVATVTTYSCALRFAAITRYLTGLVKLTAVCPLI